MQYSSVKKNVRQEEQIPARKTVPFTKVTQHVQAVYFIIHDSSFSQDWELQKGQHLSTQLHIVWHFSEGSIIDKCMEVTC
jgi:hypothetical protein